MPMNHPTTSRRKIIEDLKTRCEVAEMMISVLCYAQPTPFSS